MSNDKEKSIQISKECRKEQLARIVDDIAEELEKLMNNPNVPQTIKQRFHPSWTKKTK